MRRMDSIKRLRRKIVGVTITSLSGVLIIMTASVNAYSFAQTTKEADNTLNIIANNRGIYPEEDFFDSEENTKPVELSHGIGYCTYYFENNSPKEVIYQIPFLSRKEARKIIIQVQSKSSNNGWIKSNYRYKKYALDGKSYVTLVDQKRELEPAFHVLWASLIGSFVALCIISLILLPISNLMVKPIEENFAKQKRFISDASHELKTPLAIIALNNDIEMAEHGENANTANISKQVKQLNKIVASLNELAKLDEDEKVPFTPFDLTTLAKETITSFKGIANQYQKSFEYEIKENLTYIGNPEKIKRLISILLDNAVKYSKSFISIKIYSSNKNIFMKVENDTNGIPEGNLNAVFERFYRLEEARSSNVSGNGIGLSMAKEIVSIHHGQISANGTNDIFKISVKL